MKDKILNMLMGQNIDNELIMDIEKCLDDYERSINNFINIAKDAFKDINKNTDIIHTCVCKISEDIC